MSDSQNSLFGSLTHDLNRVGDREPGSFNGDLVRELLESIDLVSEQVKDCAKCDSLAYIDCEEIDRLLGQAKLIIQGERSTRKSRNMVRDLVNEVVAHYQKYHPKSKPGTKERTKIRGRLDDGYSANQLKEAIDGCHRSPYHCGENDRNRKYQSLELIMRDASHVDQFIEMPVNGTVLSEKTMRTNRAANNFVERKRREQSQDQ